MTREGFHTNIASLVYNGRLVGYRLQVKKFIGKMTPKEYDVEAGVIRTLMERGLVHLFPEVTTVFNLLDYNGNLITEHDYSDIQYTKAYKHLKHTPVQDISSNIDLVKLYLTGLTSSSGSRWEE